MNATDAFLGVAIILLLIWGVMMQLQLTNLSNTVSNLAAFQANQTVLFSPKEFCAEKNGFELVEEQELANDEYTITAGTKNNQRFFCFYRKTPQ